MQKFDTKKCKLLLVKYLSLGGFLHIYLHLVWGASGGGQTQATCWEEAEERERELTVVELLKKTQEVIITISSPLESASGLLRMASRSDCGSLVPPLSFSSTIVDNEHLRVQVYYFIFFCSTFFRGTVLDVETSAEGVIESTKLLA